MHYDLVDEFPQDRRHELLKIEVFSETFINRSTLFAFSLNDRISPAIDAILSLSAACSCS